MMNIPERLKAKREKCDTCANGEMKIVSDTEYTCKCRLGRTKAMQCVDFVKSHYVPRTPQNDEVRE